MTPAEWAAKWRAEAKSMEAVAELYDLPVDDRLRETARLYRRAAKQLDTAMAVDADKGTA